MVRSAYFICVNFNNSNYTNLFLESIFENEKMQNNVNVVVLIVDNASNLTDFRRLQSMCVQYSYVKLIRSETNLGYFRGLNLGLANISPSVNDYVIVGNNDLTFSSDFVRQLFGASYAANVLVVGPNVITSDGVHQNPYYITRLSVIRKFIHDVYFLNYSLAKLVTFILNKRKKIIGKRINSSASVSQFMHMGIGACYVLTPAYFKHYSQLDDSVFLYGEEALLAGQVMSVNGRTFYDADLIVNHAESAAISKLPTRLIYKFRKNSYPHIRKYL